MIWGNTPKKLQVLIDNSKSLLESIQIQFRLVSELYQRCTKTAIEIIKDGKIQHNRMSTGQKFT